MRILRKSFLYVKEWASKWFETILLCNGCEVTYVSAEEHVAMLQQETPAITFASD
jgi:hypothetical protein